MSSLPPPSSVPPPQPVPAEAGAPAQPAPLRPDDRSDEPPWPVWTAPAAVLVGLVVGVLGSVVVAGIGAAAGSTSTTPAVSLISDVVFDLGFVATALYFASTTGRRVVRPADFGYRRISVWLGIGAFFAAGAGYLLVTAVYQSIVKLHGTDKLPSDLGISTSTAALVGAALFVCVIAPICEEFFFRGFIFGGASQVAYQGRRPSDRNLAGRDRDRDPVRHRPYRLRRRPIPDSARLPRLRVVHRPVEDPLAVPVHGAALGQQLDRPRLQRAPLDRWRDPRSDRGLDRGDRGRDPAALGPTRSRRARPGDPAPAAPPDHAKPAISPPARDRVIRRTWGVHEMPRSGGNGSGGRSCRSPTSDWCRRLPQVPAV